MKYSFYCVHCGDAHFSDSKEEIKEYKAKHRRLISFYANTETKVCQYNITDRQTFARPRLTEILNEEIRKERLGIT